ncbi:hypothetical protein RclHR1_00950016 [Rhizophagus clarus]|uniref:BTB domain-containing protein n=1 Tax=Rhizophagus clarus TaxID=94130 RepID=A0A2Z6SQS6_9GLOM|nr:hypothetical protein RclHR1_00950016 [Rhizophagus clarus]GES74669.1 hypothetical protein GLOIN_2v1868927 [Rhizophagus clarus]
MSSKFLVDLSSDYEKLFDSETGYDVIICAGEESNIKEFHVHSNILCVRSQYFRSALSNEWVEKIDGKLIFKKLNISSQLFSIILRFIYCGNIELKNLQGQDVLKLLVAVDELNIQPLIVHIQEFLIKHRIEFLHQNPIGILETIYQHETLTDLLNFCLEKICEEPKILFNSDKFINLKAPLLELLLKRDDLNMDEIEIWEKILKWCFTQQNMENDPTKWNKEDITKIEKVLHKFIPLIKFYDIKPKDFFYKVYCYKEILPQELIHNLFRILYNYSYYNNETNPYEFKLLHRSSQDGFTTRSFHKNCNNKGATIWIAKIQGSTQLIGGYNPLDWSGDDNDWKSTTDSFLFNITDGKDISTAKLGYVNTANYAVYCGNYQGPKMGDLQCKDTNNWTYKVDSTDYPNVGIPANFVVENYEVYQVVKK